MNKLKIKWIKNIYTVEHIPFDKIWSIIRKATNEVECECFNKKRAKQITTLLNEEESTYEKTSNSISRNK